MIFIFEDLLKSKLKFIRNLLSSNFPWPGLRYANFKESKWLENGDKLYLGAQGCIYGQASRVFRAIYWILETQTVLSLP